MKHLINEAERMQELAGIEKGVNEGITTGALSHIEKIESILDNLIRNISTDATIPTATKVGLLRAFKELQEHVDDLGFELEIDDSEA